MRAEQDAELATLVVAAEAVTVAGEGGRAADIYEALRSHENAVVSGMDAGASAGSVAYYLGRLARAVGQLGPAVRHLEKALAIHLASGEESWVARVRCELARVLLARGDETSRRQALVELDAVRAWPQAEGTPLGDEAAGLLARARAGETGRRNLIRCDGEFWTLVFDGRTCHVRDTRGLRWLAVLLRHPGREFPVLELDAGPDAIHHSPHDCPDTAATERARVRITRALQNARRRISVSHPALGRHLASTVRTGRACSYVPDPRLPIEWTS